MMKKYIQFLYIAIAAFSVASCSDGNDLPDVKPSDRGTVTDNEGNVYDWVRIGDQLWTTTNAKNGSSLADATYYDGWDYNNVLSTDEATDYAENYLPEYGNLVTLEDAIANAPEGWRVPTDEDWQKLERTLGMKDTDRIGFGGEGVAYSLINKDGGTQLNLGFGGACFMKQVLGWVEVNLDSKEESGYYWTSTTTDKYDLDYPMVYYRRITVNYGKVQRACMRADSYLSVRWVKDAK